MILGIEASHLTRSQYTGVEEYCFQVIKHLQKVIPADVRVVLYVNKLTINNEQLAGEMLRNLPVNWEVKVLRWPLKKLWSQTRLAWELLWHPPDVFFAPAQLIPWVVPKKTVVMIHDSAFKVWPSVYHFWGRQYLKLMNWWILKKALAIVTSSEFNKRELERLYPWLDMHTVSVIPLAYDQARFNQQVSGAIDNFGITKPYIVSIGRLEEKKNTARIVEAFNIVNEQRLNTKDQNIQLVLVGKPGVGYQKVKIAIEKSAYRSDIVELGYVASGDLPVLLKNAEAFVFPSLYEGFGIPVLEAMAVGCPVITSDQSALSEVAGDAALFVKPTNATQIAAAIVELLNKPQKHQELAQKGLHQALELSWNKTAQKTWQIIAKASLI